MTKPGDRLESFRSSGARPPGAFVRREGQCELRAQASGKHCDTGDHIASKTVSEEWADRNRPEIQTRHQYYLVTGLL